MTYFFPYFSVNVGRKTDYASHFLSVLKFNVRDDFSDYAPAMLDTIPFLVASPLQTLTNAGAVSSMKTLIVRGTFNIRKVTKGTCAQDGLIDVEVKLCESFLCPRSFRFRCILLLDSICGKKFLFERKFETLQGLK